MKEKIFAQAKKIHNKTIEWRSHLHKNPELSFQEYKTAQYIAEQIKAMGISDIRVMADTGHVVHLKGEKEDSNKVIAFRADIDALPIHEENQVEFNKLLEDFNAKARRIGVKLKAPGAVDFDL